MKDYKRLTDRDDDGIPYVKCADCYIRDKCDLTKEVCYQELQDRLAEIEDKIENGEIDYAADSKTEQTITDLLIEFDEMGFAPTTVCPNLEQYATEWRERVRKEFTRLTAERDDYKSRAEIAEQKATVWKDCASRWQKYYKGQAEREIEEEEK